jgi:hypothetical protein
MSEKRKTPIRVATLESVVETLGRQLTKLHYRTRHYGSEDTCNDQETKALESAKADLINKISKEIEEYAVKKYEKYGIIIVPLCRRKDASGDDRLNLDLKMKVFPGLDNLFKAKEARELAYKADLKKLEEWYTAALKALLKREELPEYPTFAGPGDE